MKLYAGSMMHRLFILPWRQDFEFPLNNGLPFCMETWHINHTCSPSLIRFVVEDVANTMFYLGNLRENRYNCAQQTSGMVARQLLLMPPDFRDPDSILTFGAACVEFFCSLHDSMGFHQLLWFPPKCCTSPTSIDKGRQVKQGMQGREGFIFTLLEVEWEWCAR